MFVQWFYEEAPSRCRSGRKGGRSDPTECEYIKRASSLSRGEKKENERKKSIIFWENSPATNRII